MATNPNVLIDREKYIGGSEISTILNINKFKKRYDLLLEKAQMKDLEEITNPYIDYGNVMEAKIRDYLNENEDDKFVEDTIIKEEDVISLRCNYDGLNSTKALEIKTTSQIHQEVREYKYYIVQLLYGMILANRDKGILAVYHRPDDFDENFDADRLQIFEIDKKDYEDWVVEIIEEITKFKLDLQKLKSNPLMSEEDFIPVDIKEVAEQLDLIETQLIAFKELEEQQKELKEKLFNAMSDANIKSWETINGTKITRVDATSDSVKNVFDETKFKKEHEDMYEEYQIEKITKGKAGYIKITPAKK